MNKILIPKAGNSAFTMIYAKTGSRNEPKELKGISHFLEHMMFKGTRTKTAKQIAYSIEKYGADLNAWTDYELTAYWIKSANKYKKNAESILMDMLHNSFFPQRELDKERNVVLQEMNMYEDSPRSVASEAFQKELFDEADGLHLPIIGTKETLANIDRTKMLDYYHNKYKDLTFLQIGDVEDSIKIEENKNTRPPKLPLRKEIKGRNDKIIRKPGINQANIIVGNALQPFSTNNLDTIVLMDLLEGIMNDMSGRLFSKLREEHNLCYRIHFGMSIYSCGCPYWWVSLGLDKDKIDQAYDLIMEELKKPITSKELKYATTKKIGERSMRNDNLSSLAQAIAYLDLKNVDYTQYINNYEKLIETNKGNFKDFLTSINFENNVVAQVIPE